MQCDDDDDDISSDGVDDDVSSGGDDDDVLHLSPPFLIAWELRSWWLYFDSVQDSILQIESYFWS